MILDLLFKFPIIMTDNDNEEKKNTIYGGTGNNPDADIVIGEAEYPYMSLLGLSDRWLPDADSFTNALENREFNACYVSIANVGTFLCPWTKEKFKDNFRKFVDNLKPAQEPMQLVKLSKEDLQKILDNYDKNGEPEGE